MDMNNFFLKPDKNLDQYFLTEQSVLDKEVALAGLSESDVVLEIGAGFGSLTEKIAQRCRVIAVEKDARFLPYLKKIKNAEVIHGDALDVTDSVTFNKVISNIPYSISQPLLLRLLKRKWDSAVLIVQKEFAGKLASNTKLGMLIRDCADFRIAMAVPRKYFHPIAPFDSSMILLRQKKTMDEKFWKFLSSAYRQKNRDVKNVFKHFHQGLAKKKVHQLHYEEIKALHEMNRQA